MHQQVFHLVMLQNLNKILARLENTIDSDDIILLGEEIECDFNYTEVIELKKMLKHLLCHEKKFNIDPLHIKYLISYL